MWVKFPPHSISNWYQYLEFRDYQDVSVVSQKPTSIPHVESSVQRPAISGTQHSLYHSFDLDPDLVLLSWT